MPQSAARAALTSRYQVSPAASPSWLEGRGQLSYNKCSHVCVLTGSPSPSPPCRKLVPDGFGSGEADQDFHPQQPHLHAHRAHGDKQNARWRDQTGGPSGGKHPVGRRRKPLQGCFWRLFGQRKPQQLCWHHCQT